MIVYAPEEPQDQAAPPVTWQACEDIVVIDDDEETILYRGPKYLRCKLPECRTVITHGMVQSLGGCWCGNRTCGPAIRLTRTEQDQLRSGYYPLVSWEAALIQPTLPEGKTCGWGQEDWKETHG